MTRLLIDADYLAYKTCAACEEDLDFGNDVIVVTSRFGEVTRAFEREIKRIAEHLGCDPINDTILFFSSSDNFRKTVDPSYKGHRNRKKPCGYKRLINWCGDRYMVIMVDGLEADDAIGIWATDPREFTEKEQVIVVSPDKDMRQIPGFLYTPMGDGGVEEIEEDEAWRWFLIQTMAGDQTDGYAGVPGIGVKKAADLIDKHGDTWQTVLGAFLNAGLTETDALTNARLARILQYHDFDHGRNKPILFDPNAGAYRFNVDRAAVQDEED